MSKGKFGGAGYQPKQLGPEPATAPITTTHAIVESPPAEPSPSLPPEPSSPRAESAKRTSDAAATAELERLRAVKVPFSSRITVAAEQQLKAMAREGRSQTDLLAEALNLLFKRHGKRPVA
jgi:hypothetical protein